MTDAEKANPPAGVVKSMFLDALVETITSGIGDPMLIYIMNDILNNELKSKLEDLIERAKNELGIF